MQPAPEAHAVSSHPRMLADTGDMPDCCFKNRKSVDEQRKGVFIFNTVF